MRFIELNHFHPKIQLEVFDIEEEHHDSIITHLKENGFDAHVKESVLYVETESIGDLDLPTGTLVGIISQGEHKEIRSIKDLDQLSLLKEALKNQTEVFENTSIHF